MKKEGKRPETPTFLNANLLETIHPRRHPRCLETAFISIRRPGTVLPPPSPSLLEDSGIQGEDSGIQAATPAGFAPSPASAAGAPGAPLPARPGTLTLTAAPVRTPDPDADRSFPAWPGIPSLTAAPARPGTPTLTSSPPSISWNPRGALAGCHPRRVPLWNRVPPARISRQLFFLWDVPLCPQPPRQARNALRTLHSSLWDRGGGPTLQAPNANFIPLPPRRRRVPRFWGPTCLVQARLPSAPPSEPSLGVPDQSCLAPGPPIAAPLPNPDSL